MSTRVIKGVAKLLMLPWSKLDIRTYLISFLHGSSRGGVKVLLNNLLPSPSNQPSPDVTLQLWRRRRRGSRERSGGGGGGGRGGREEEGKKK